jgi:RNA polymerase sigma-70 factor (ECF subfamily)
LIRRVDDKRKDIPDEELMLRVKDGEIDCFRELVQRHQRSVINTAFRITGNHQEAEDIAQEVFLRVYRFAPDYEPDAKFSTYLYRITFNLSLNQVRRAKTFLLRFFSGEQDFEGERTARKTDNRLLGTPLTSLEKEEVKKGVRKAIRLLPKRQRAAIILSQYEGLSYQEISQVLNCSKKAVERLIHRAKSQLKRELTSFLQ